MGKYGYRHRLLRKALVPAAWGEPCVHCGETMTTADALDLDHTTDGLGYRGVVHASCNRSEGGKRGAAKRTNTPRRSRKW